MNYGAGMQTMSAMPAAPREAHLLRINDRITDLCGKLSDAHGVLATRADSIMGPVPTPINEASGKDSGLIPKEPPLLRRIELGLDRLEQLSRQFYDVAQRMDQL